MSSKGFTIVELAIVLVIVGVIIAGVLKGSAFIDLARAKKVMTDAANLVDAQNRFREREKRYAGDFDDVDGTMDGAINFSTLSGATLDDSHTSSVDADFPFDELKNDGFLPNVANSLLAQTQNGGVMYFAGLNNAGHNDMSTGNNNFDPLCILVIRGVTCLAAFQMEMNIDNDMPSDTSSASAGRIRRITGNTIAGSGQWTSADTDCVTGTQVDTDNTTNIAYIFN